MEQNSSSVAIFIEHPSKSSTISVLSGSSTTTTLNLTVGSSGTSTYSNLWGSPSFILAREVGEAVEFLYEQTSMVTLAIHPAPPPKRRVFKIVFSCKDGKWHKSEPIFGKIIPAHDEYYEFDETVL